jgi:hypothetical protein
VQLATLREYGVAARPQAVYWLLFLNDLSNLEVELGYPELTAYLDPNYSQGLKAKRSILDRQLNIWLNEQESQKKLTFQDGSPFFRMLRWAEARLSLRGIRGRVSTMLPLSPTLQQGLDEAMARCKADVASWNGSLTALVLPDLHELRLPRGTRGTILRELEDAARKADIRLLNAADALRRKGSAEDFFPLRRNGHYNAKGYRVIAELIAEDLQGR